MYLYRSFIRTLGGAVIEARVLSSAPEPARLELQMAYPAAEYISTPERIPDPVYGDNPVEVER